MAVCGGTICTTMLWLVLLGNLVITFGEEQDARMGNVTVLAAAAVSVCTVPFVTNGYVSAPSKKFMPGEYARLFCSPGYSVNPRNALPFIRCNSDGSWGSFSDTQLSCDVDTALGCRRPFDLANGGYRLTPNDTSIVSNSVFASGTTVVYHCRDGFRMTPDETPRVTCVNGAWFRTGRVPFSCVRRQITDRCRPIGNNPNTKHYVLQSVKVDVAMHDSSGMFVHGTKVVYVCEPGYRQIGPSLMECVTGEWSNRGPTCLRHLGCSSSPPSVPNAEYSFSFPSSALSSGNESVVAGEGSQAFYFCQGGYRMHNVKATALKCRDGTWVGHMPVCEKTVNCQPPVNVENANWVVGSVWGDYRVGAVARYECSTGYNLIGASVLTCQADGVWSDEAPRCLLPDEYCSQPRSVANGFFVCKPTECGSFLVGTEIFYFCRQGFQRQTTDSGSPMICMPGGLWKGETPVCSAVYSDDHGSAAANFLPPDHVVSSPFTVVVSTSGTLVGVLVLIVLAFALRWILAKHRRRLIPTGPNLLTNNASSDMLVPPYSVTPSELDRLALIRFADDAYLLPVASLPSYEDALRSCLPAYVAQDVTRRCPISYSRSGRSNEYRQLASVHPSAVRSGTPTNDSTRRNSIVTMASNNLSAAGVSAGFGSIDTINVAPESDATSVTVNTYDSMASNPSISASQRATRGSLESSSAHASLCGDVVCDQQRGGSGGSSMLEHYDGANDTLRSQTNRSLYSDNASRIVELPEEQKND